MAKFLNKKEQVYDLQLTSYGRYTLSIGSFKPTYYAFYDDNIIYDFDYARATGSVPPGFLSGTTEPQNEIHKRIKQDTQYLESFILFEDVEETKQIISWEDGNFNTDINPTKRDPRKDVFRYNTSIGDAFLDGDANVAPAWKIVTLQGEIMSVDLEDATGSTRVPQLNIQANYTKKVVDYNININPSSFEEIVAVAGPFADGKQIQVVAEDILVYGEEVNTELLMENFDVEIFEIVDDTASQASGSITINGTIYNEDMVTINDGINTVTFEFDNDSSVSGSNTAITFIPSESGAPATIAKAFKKAIEKSVLNIDFGDNDPQGFGAYATLSLTNRKVGVGGNQSISASNTNSRGPSTSVLGMAGGVDGNNVLSRKYFQKEDTQIQDGYMTAEKPTQVTTETLTTASVEYWFDFLADQQVDQKLACKGAEIFNKTSYYVDIDFDCEEDEEVLYYDIYGAATEPEICQD